MESGRSITNKEYLEAKAKGIPIYVFVQKKMLNILSVWESNPDADYSNFVDTPKLFEFIKKLRSGNEHWVYEFDEVKHICEILLLQLSHLFMEGLTLRKRMRNLDVVPLSANLSGKSLSILFERGVAWEYRLFTSVLSDEISLAKDVRWDLKYELKTLHVRSIEKTEVMGFLKEKLSIIKALVNDADNIVNVALQEALGPPGMPGNSEHIIYCGKRIAEIYRKCLIWKIEFSCVEVNENYINLLFLTARMSNEVIDSLETMSEKFDAEINAAQQAFEKGEERKNGLIIQLNIPHIDGFTEECERLTKWVRSVEYANAD